MLKPPELQEGYPDWLAKHESVVGRRLAAAGVIRQPRLPLDAQDADDRAVARLVLPHHRLVGSDISRDAGYVEEDYILSLKIVGPSGIAKTNNAGSNQAYMIARKSDHPEAVIKYVNWLYSGGPDDVTNYLIASWGIPGEDWEWIDQDAEDRPPILSAGSSVCEEKYSRVTIRSRWGWGRKLGPPRSRSNRRTAASSGIVTGSTSTPTGTSTTVVACPSTSTFLRPHLHPRPVPRRSRPRTLHRRGEHQVHLRCSPLVRMG